MKITSVADLPQWGLRTAIYGSPGTGKTYLAATAEDSEFGKSVLFIDVEGGVRSITHRTSIDTVQARTWPEITEVLRAIKMGSSDLKKYKTFVWDNLTEYQKLDIARIAGDSQPQIQHWGECTTDMLNLVRDMSDVSRTRSLNQIFIAWDEDVQTDVSGIKIIKHRANFTPKLQNSFPGMLDMVGYLTVSSRLTRTLTFEVSNTTDAKNRRPRTGPTIALPETIRYKIDDSPMADILNTMIGGMPWPEKYNEKTVKPAIQTQ